MIDKVVVDASFLLSVVLPDESDQVEQKNFLKQYHRNEIRILAPELIYYETINAVKSAFLRKRIDEKVGKELVELILDLNIDLVEPDFKQAFELALKHDLSVYDAAYLNVAQKNNCQFLSLDKKLTCDS